MPKMSHAMAGWLTDPGSVVLARAASYSIPASTRVPDQPGLWKYRTVRRSKGILIFSLLFSLGLHAIALLGFNQRHRVAKQASVAEDPVVQMVMPDLQED